MLQLGLTLTTQAKLSPNRPTTWYSAIIFETAGRQPQIPFTGTGNTTDISEYTAGTGNVAASHQLEEYYN